MQRLHDEVYQHRAFAAQFLQVDFLRVVRSVHRAAVVDKVLHLHVQDKRLVGVLHVKGIEAAILRDDAHVRLAAEVPDRRLHADDVLRAVRLARYQVGRTQVHVAHRRRKQDVDGLVIRDFQTVRRYHAVEHQLLRQTVVQVAVLLRLRIDILHQFQPVLLGGGGAVVRHSLRVGRTGDAHQQGKHCHYFLDTHFTLDLVVNKKWFVDYFFSFFAFMFLDCSFLFLVEQYPVP